MATLRETLLSQNAYKSIESEGFLDLYFYRPGGAVLALAGMRLGLSPNSLTAASLVTGVAGACLLYWDASMWGGIALIILSGVFDASDGQLARMTQTSSRMGRILDGVSDYFVFIATYLVLAFKYLSLHPEGSPHSIFFLVIGAGMSHSMQSSLFDYYRNAYTDYVDRRQISILGAGEGDAPREGIVETFLWWTHHQYTNRQGRLALSHVELGKALKARLPKGALSNDFAKKYKELNLPLVWWWNLLGANSRLLVMTAALIVHRPELYLAAEVVLYNACAFITHRRQVRADRALLQSV